MQKNPCDNCKNNYDITANKCRYCQHYAGNRMQDNFKPLNNPFNNGYNLTSKKE